MNFNLCFALSWVAIASLIHRALTGYWPHPLWMILWFATSMASGWYIERRRKRKADKETA